MKTDIKSHIFWKFAFKGKYPLFEAEEGELYSRIMAVVKWIPILFLGFQFLHLFNVSDFSKANMVSSLWPIVPFQDVPTNIMVLCLHINMFIAFASLCFYGQSFLLKLYAFVTYFFYVAFAHSFGKIDHVLHLPLMILFGYLLMPSKRIDQYKAKTILVFASLQFFLLFSYTLTGLWKLFWGVVQYVQGEVSVFSPLSLRNTLVYQFHVNTPTLLGEWLIEHYYLGWIAFWMVLYLEVCSVWVFFKANLHKIWGVLLIALHLAIALIMDVVMFTAPITLGVLLLMSPFYKPSNVKTTLLSFPIISLVGRFFNKDEV
ncbi:hypothetical protein [Formosa sp. A9]|uniref:hypothetical protein n=1 Tax=Formosa sp. A9 TaxID=3442641 RepID=UPI003EBF9561